MTSQGTSQVTSHEPDEEYAGPADLRLDDLTLTVPVTLRGAFQPIDGRFHWYGRVDATVAEHARNGVTVKIATPYGESIGRLSDLDPWGRLRISGTGRPPF